MYLSSGGGGHLDLLFTPPRCVYDHTCSSVKAIKEFLETEHSLQDTYSQFIKDFLDH